VTTFDGGGIIAYERRNGSLVITLNTPAGLARKLQQLGIDLTPAISRPIWREALLRIPAMPRSLYVPSNGANAST
jgi:hypothetical protein